MEQKMIPYFCHEGDMARAERTNKRLWILCILLIILLVSSYAGFFYYESQFETEKTIVTQDLDTKGSGDAVIYDGVHFNGAREADSNKNQKSQKE